MNNHIFKSFGMFWADCAVYLSSLHVIYSKIMKSTRIYTNLTAKSALRNRDIKRGDIAKTTKDAFF